MATNLTVDSADKSSRWYITPGTSSTYDLQVHNDTDRAVLCRVTLASHPDTGSIKPQSLTLQARETRNVAVTFGPEAKLPRDRKAVITVKDAAGQVLKTIERELVSGASTDATIELSWKAPLIEEGKLCGFVLLCNIRSLSGAADEFTPEFGAHAALRFPTLSPVWLEPGDTAHLELPIRWDRTLRDAEGWNHPRAIEVFVGVSQGRRSGRLSWDVVQRSIGDLLDRSDRSPVVERKAAAPSFAPASANGATASPANVNGTPAAPERANAPLVIVAPKDVNPSRPLEVVKPIAPAAAVAAAAVVESAAPPQPAAQPQPAPQAAPSQPQAPPQTSPQTQAKPLPPEPPKKIRYIAAEVQTNFDGYRPAFQLVNSQTVGQRAAHAAGPASGDSAAVAVHDAQIQVDDLDSSIVGSGLNYARNGNGASLSVQSGRRRGPAGAWIAGIAVAAVLGFVLFRPHAPAAHSTSSGNTAAAPAAVAPKGPAVMAAAHAARPKQVAHVAPKPKIAPPSPAAVVQTPAQTAAPAVQSQPVPVHVAAAVHTAPARPVYRRPPPIDRSALPTVDFVNAAYGRYGRAVSVQWDSVAQASADVQLTDARGRLIAERAVRGGRSLVVMGLPRGFHGDVYVQVSVTGYHSERVVQTSSLTPF